VVVRLAAASADARNYHDRNHGVRSHDTRSDAAGSQEVNELQKATACAIVNVFETGRVRGDYAAVGVLKGDKGHLSYGRSQAALGTGSLLKLLTLYCQQPGARFAAQIGGLLPRVQQVDTTLDQDVTAKALLQQAAREDPVMRQAQDQFFD